MILAAIFGGCKDSRKPLIMTGMIETSQIDVAAKVPGHIDELRVHEGDAVKQGDTLAVLESRELDAKVGQADAALAAAQAKLSMAKTGLRPQEKDAAQRLYEQAKAQSDLAEKTWARVQKLSADSVISIQERDQVEAQYLAAKEAMEAAKSRMSLAQEGSRAEDRIAAQALVTQAAQAKAEASAWFDERILTSPINGEVAMHIANCGEMVGAGAPILTLTDPADVWLVVNVKETQMKSFRMGTQMRGRVPALGDSLVNFRVSYIAALGDFASWRPTSQKGGFDVKTFEIHLRPLQNISGLRAGMSVNLELE